MKTQKEFACTEKNLVTKDLPAITCSDALRMRYRKSIELASTGVS